MPLPLAMMIPFMGIQSAVMAKQFGENFQYGKRRISAMSNDEFNKLTPKMLQDNANAELKAMIPSMQASITDMRGFQEFLVKEFIRMVDSLIQAGLGSLLGLSQQAGEQALKDIEHFLHGHFDLHLNEPTPEPPLPTCPSGQHWDVSIGKCVADEPEPEPLILTQDKNWLNRNAQGRLIRLTSTVWELGSSPGITAVGAGFGNVIGRYSEATGLNNGVAAWPNETYSFFSWPHDQKSSHYFWVLKSRLP